MSSGKSGTQSKDFHGHCAGIVSQGQLDFIWGLLINNELVYPNAALWDSKIYQSGRQTLYTDGNVYKAGAKTDQVPPTFPWSLLATAWASGGSGYSIGDKVVSSGFVFSSLINSNTAVPPAAALSDANWEYVSTPTLWTTLSATHFWNANSIVAWEGRLYVTNADTNAQPPSAPWSLWKIDRSASPNPLKMTVTKNSRFGTNAGPGDWYLYWGTGNQVLDVSGEAILTALGHPPYRNRAVIMGKDILFGTMTASPPNVQVLGGRIPVQSLIVNNTGVVGYDSTALDADWQINPWCALAELLTHPVIGLGLPLSWFDATSWQREADRCGANPSLYYISPMITSLRQVSDVVSDLLGYPDAFILWSVVATLIAGHWPHGDAPPAFNGQNTINQNNIETPIAWDSQGWEASYNSVTLMFQDIQAAFNDRPVTAPNLFNLQAIRRVQPLRIDRPHIVRLNQALAWATEAAKLAGDRTRKGELTAKAENIPNVTPGALFLLTDDMLGVSEVQRCTRRTISGSNTRVKIQHETERGASPQPYSPSTLNPSEAQGPSPAPILSYAVAQLPKSLAGESNSIAVLAGRQNDVTTQVDIWFRQADGAAFQQIGTNSAFAVAGTIKGNGDTVSALLTTNSAPSATYNYPPGTIAFGSLISVFDSGGTFLGHFTYGTDYTFDLVNQTVTLTAGTTIPNGSTVVVGALGGALVTSSATPGNTYNIPKNFWGTYNVWKMAVGATYTGGLTGGTHCTEGTDYLIDPDSGTLTVITGGAIASTDKVFIFFTDNMVVQFATNTPSDDIDSISAPLTQDEINDNDLIAFVFKAANPSQFEIMSVAAVSAAVQTYPVVANSGYNLSLKRQQFGSQFAGGAVSDFAAGDLIFVIPRAQLSIFSNLAFPGLAETSSAATFILAPQSAWVASDISDIYDATNNPSGLSTEFSYTFENLYAPTVTWIQQQKNGTNISSFAGAFLTTDSFYFSFQMNASAGGNIIAASLTGLIGEQQVTLWSQTFDPSTQQNAAVAFQLTSPGLWSLFLNVRCDDGTQLNYPLTLVGSTTPVQMQVNTPAATYAPTPLLQDGDYRVVNHMITGLKFGALPTGLTVLYQLQARGTALNPAAWSTASTLSGGGTFYGTVPNFMRGQKTLYAKSQKAGSTDSPVVSWNL
jgi:hypothetical protein